MKVLIVDDNKQIFDLPNTLLHGRVEISRAVSIQAGRAVCEDSKPEVVVLKPSIAGAAEFEKWLRRRRIKVLLIGQDLKDSFSASELESKLEGLFPKEKKSLEAVQSGQVISFWRMEGGVGVTTLVISLSQYLESLGLKDILVVDLNFSEGASDLSVHFNLPKVPHLAMLSDLTDGESWQEILIFPDNCRISIAQPPPTLKQAQMLDKRDLSFLIDQARKRFTITLVDLPNSYSDLILETVSQSSTLVLVTSLREGGLTRLSFLDKMVDTAARRVLLVNRDTEKDRKYKALDEVEHLLKMPIITVIEEDSSLNSLDKTSEGIKRLADLLLFKSKDEGISTVMV